MTTNTTNEAPAWVENTLAEHTYSLALFENDDVSVEDIRLTRTEYIGLKQYLASLRGYSVANG